MLLEIKKNDELKRNKYSTIKQQWKQYLISGKISQNKHLFFIKCMFITRLQSKALNFDINILDVSS